MYPFSQSVTPAAKTHMEAQLSFFHDISKSLFRSIQQFTELNIQLAQTLLEETSTTGQEIITAQKPTEIFSAAAAHAQPAVGKIRAYQQHISRIAADAQVDLAKVAEEHMSETGRTAKALADEVARVASEETEKNVRNQQDAMKKFTDPFKHFAENDAQHRQPMRGSESMQSASGHGSQSGNMEDREGQGSSMQGSGSSTPSGATQGSGKPGSSSRKE